MSAVVSGAIAPVPSTALMWLSESSLMKKVAFSSSGSDVAITGSPAASLNTTLTSKFSTLRSFRPLVIFMCASKACRSRVSSWTISIFTFAQICADATLGKSSSSARGTSTLCVRGRLDVVLRIIGPPPFVPTGSGRSL